MQMASLTAYVRHLGWTWRQHRLAAPTLLWIVVVALVIGIPTDVVPNPWFTRMTPIYTDQYAWWIATSVLTGALLANTCLSASARQTAPAAK